MDNVNEFGTPLDQTEFPMADLHATSSNGFGPCRKLTAATEIISHINHKEIQEIMVTYPKGQVITGVSQKDTVCKEIQEIMVTYREQEAAGRIDTPGGLEHMGDVWRLLRKWDKLLSE